MLKEHAANHADQPFFQYLAFTAPHFPLQAPAADIDRYRGAYDQGWELVRKQRWDRVQQLGIVKGELSAVEPLIGPPYHYAGALKKLGPDEVNRPLPWTELTEKQRKFQAAKMEIHAAMVDRMDREIGRVLEQLRASGVFDNTLILFLSDNGASAEIMVRDAGHDRAAKPGSAATHLSLGPGWSTVANTPLIAHWPAGFTAQGELRRQPGHVIDIVPTILEVAGAAPPKTANGVEIPAAPGVSLVSAFAADTLRSRAELWWGHEGNRALRVGDWKLVAAKKEPWELYDLSSDRTETNNLAAVKPDTVKKLAERWQRNAEAFAQMHRQRSHEPVKE